MSDELKKYRVAVIPGDGIGPEVTAEAVRALKAAARAGGFGLEFDEYPWGCGYYHRTGRMMPADGLGILSGYDAILLGAVGDPSVPDHISLGGLLLEIRKGFDQYVNLRPVKLLAGAPCPLKGKESRDIDMVFVRENTEGEYSGKGEWKNAGLPDETVIQYG
ncbi:MAG: tartrate dehydrogenase, partial [Clostridia bacterium]|nr:tartrate dehydrogenase [Clostridia bacterium]